MELTTGTRTMAGVAATAAAVGLTVVLFSIIRSDTARAMGGTCLTLTALTAVALILIRRWICDTSDERRILQASQREAQAERSRYIAAQAALENEQGRLTRDRAAERQADAARAIAERRAMQDEFEDKRADLVAETIEATVQMIWSKKDDPAQATRSKVIQFPHQHQQPGRERSREHGVVGP